MDEKYCWLCKNYKKYFGFPYCVKNPNKPCRLDTNPSNPKCFEVREEKNHTYKPKPFIKERINFWQNFPFEPGDCQNCILHLTHLNYCCAFGMNCNTFECYYKNLNNN